MVRINLSPSKVALLCFYLSRGRKYGFSVSKKNQSESERTMS